MTEPRRVFELTPLIIAAVIGAVALYLFAGPIDPTSPDKTSNLGTGAVVGAAVQIGVRMLGVS